MHCQQAVKALKNNNNDIVNAIMVREYFDMLYANNLYSNTGTHHVMMNASVFRTTLCLVAVYGAFVFR